MSGLMPVGYVLVAEQISELPRVTFPLYFPTTVEAHRKTVQTFDRVVCALCRVFHYHWAFFFSLSLSPPPLPTLCCVGSGESKLDLNRDTSKHTTPLPS